MSQTQRRSAKVYGKKICAPGKSATSAIFSAESPTLANDSETNMSSTRPALDDITDSLNHLWLGKQQTGFEKEKSEKIISQEEKEQTELPLSSQNSNPDADKPPRPARSKKARSKPLADNHPEWLQPLVKAYEKNGTHKMLIRKWSDILDEDWGLEKIAESSYAEVYKVSNGDGTSILKMMALRPPTGLGSQRETSVEVTSVISEVLIMDLMAEIPGFLEFKGAHIIEGRPTRAIKGAYQAHAEKNESFFPQPGAYHKEQLFLALELGDAGTDIEHFKITTISQLWDILFGIVIALSHGEALASFEHRDLHEGNVCVRQVGNLISCAPKQRHKFGYSGLEVTLLDYTLSRASSGEETIFLDLDKEPELFAESDLLQHQVYRRMRAWKLSRSHGLSPHPSTLTKPRATPRPLLPPPPPPPSKPSLSSSSLSSSSSNSWRDFMPYTNVIWTYYMFDYVIKNYEGVISPLRDFLKETKDLRDRLHPDRRCFGGGGAVGGGFACASEVLDYCVARGWIDEEDLMGDINENEDEDEDPSGDLD